MEKYPKKLCDLANIIKDECSDCANNTYCNNHNSYYRPFNPNFINLLCNSCGENVYNATNYKNTNEKELREEYFVKIQYTGGYNSDYLTDTIGYDCFICEKCLRNMFDNFKIKPYTRREQVFEDTDDYDNSYNEDSEYFKNKKFKESPKFIENYRNKICNMYYSCKNKAIYSYKRVDYNGNSKIIDLCSCKKHASFYFNDPHLIQIKYVPEHVRVIE